MAIYVPIISEWNPKGLEKAMADFNKLEGAGAKTKYAIEKAAVPAAAALGGLAAAAGTAVKGAMEDAQAAEELARQLKATTGATNAQVKATEDWITKTSLASGVADDDLRPALANLVRYTGDVGKAQDMTSLAMDIATAKNLDLTSVSNALGKAYNNNFNALKKLGIPMTGAIQNAKDHEAAVQKQAKAQDKLSAVQGMVEAGALSGKDAAKALAKAQDDLAKANAAVTATGKENIDWAGVLTSQFGGATAKAADTAQGRFKKFNNALKETWESIGYALMPVVDAILPKLEAFGAWAQNHVSTIVTIGAVIGGLAATILAVNFAMKVWTAATTLWSGATKIATGIQAAFNAVMYVNPVVLVVVAIAALAAGLVLAYKKVDWFRDAVDSVWGLLKKVGSFIGDVFVGYFRLLRAEAGLVAEVFTKVFGTVVDVVKGAINFIIKGWNAIEFKIPGFKVGPIGYSGFTLGLPDIPLLAAGGVVTKPTLAMIGEAGPEAVVPLSRGGAPSFGSRGDTYNIHVTSADPRAVVDALVKYQRQNGAIPIKVR